ncbi:hypothetical protein RND81_04G032300 [Saponaria officinalis]|uniref:Uncharacterized protein n=1 Tax=Saponaria officinalis TaxID=3572 RepID=A0AAW1LGG2_SAPOF
MSAGVRYPSHESPAVTSTAQAPTLTGAGPSLWQNPVSNGDHEAKHASRQLPPPQPLQPPSQPPKQQPPPSSPQQPRLPHPAEPLDAADHASLVHHTSSSNGSTYGDSKNHSWPLRQPHLI